MKATLILVTQLPVLAGCVTAAKVETAFNAKADSTVRAQLATTYMPLTGKWKGNTFIFQQAGPGGSNSADVADNRNAGRGQGAAAIGPAANATNESKRASSTPWQVYVVLVVVSALAGALGWEWLRQRLALGGLLRWRAPPA